MMVKLIWDIFCYFSKLFLKSIYKFESAALREHALSKSTLVQICDLNNSVCSKIFMNRNTYGIIILHIFRVDTVTVSST